MTHAFRMMQQLPATAQLARVVQTTRCPRVAPPAAAAAVPATITASMLVARPLSQDEIRARAFRERCVHQPHFWEQLDPPDALSRKKEVREGRSARCRSIRPAAWLRSEHAVLVAKISLQLVQLKNAYRRLDVYALQEQAKALKRSVHALRVNERAQCSKSAMALPPRGSQYRGVGNQPSEGIVAWAAALDTWMLAQDQDPGPLLAHWRNTITAHSLSSSIRLTEALQLPAMQKLRPYQRRSQCDVAMATIREYIANPSLWSRWQLAREVQTLRVLLTALGTDEASLPPHREQYTQAAGFTSDTTRAWVDELKRWLDNRDAAPIYELGAHPPLPDYDAL